MSSSYKSSKASTVATQHDNDELLVTKGSLTSTRSNSPEILLQVNQKFARSFEERKRKEELLTLEKRGLHDNDDDESESETEDEDGEELTRELDSDIRKTLKLIRTKDPAIYNSSITFFRQSETSQVSDKDADAGGVKIKKEKNVAPLYYKDMVRQQAIAGDVSGSDDNDDDDDDEKPVQTYADEQAEIKKTFLASLEENEEGDDETNELDGGLFTMRKKNRGEQKQENEDYREFTSKYGSKLKKGEIDPDKFLEHYLSSEGWKDKTAVVPHYDEIVKEDEEDAEALEKAEEFEHSYNFRFEEQGSSVIQTHARHIDDTMRREDDSRKRKRAERKERKALERQKKEEELRRLKNLKQAEIEQKLKKVARLMGEEEGTAGLKAEDLEGDFDPDEYDKRMQAVFNEQYYDEDDDMEKPTWDEDEDKELFAGLPVDPEEEEEEGDAEGDATLSEEAEVEEDDEEKQALVEEDEEGQDGKEEAPKHLKLTINEIQRQKQKYLDELYSLDYEDLIGDIKCRFKYRQVQNNDFGLTVDEIMAADDSELKQLVSLKRMAPYADSEYFIDRKRLKNFKKSVRVAQEENRRRKHTKEPADNKGIQKEEAEQPKKRKRSKKKKAMEKEANPEEDKTLSEEEKPIPKRAKVKSESAEPAAEKASVDIEKKKRRSKKKRSGEKNVHASTGLPTSRLESYKLL
ncbi:hypothetical protein KXD40_003570 [Peronospora effusa]|uniref:Kri1-like C-terminal domain-containing protein n=1 Tax=Peronospora effusa TaxID=542832 RepID=A0A3M6VCK5_9STRA|nr:hypothetical protein DD238_005487 [Peronospora effusa]RQM09679.1 hypothetical protein DD237_005557 [Peronospora effusa]UIZ22924.1 hypothetical protein KXD40_003570 [Peronospora effusa]CAI5729568.1 unnamed protein product [Peronospora effusa]